MKTKKKNTVVRFNMIIHKDVVQMAKVLREKHYINVSSLCRDAIVNMYRKLEK